MTTWLVVIGVILLVVVVARLRRRPDGRYLGARLLALDDPLLLNAKRRAKETLPVFLELAPAHLEDSMVNFPLAVTEGYEQVWADVRHIEGRRLRVSVAHDLVDRDVHVQDEQEIGVEEITDWQIEMSDGPIRGGFTSHAMFAIFRRDGHPIPREAVEDEVRFVDC